MGSYYLGICAVLSYQTAELPVIAREAPWQGRRPHRHSRPMGLIGSYDPPDALLTLLVDKSYDQLQQLAEDGSLHYFYGAEEFRPVVWRVIYIGLFITMGFSYIFGIDTFPSQALMCAIFSSLLGLSMLAILELIHSCQQSVVGSGVPLRFALTRMNGSGPSLRCRRRVTNTRCRPAAQPE
jgi:hypothetical protein